MSPLADLIRTAARGRAQRTMCVQGRVPTVAA